ncbi:MAG: response regulator [Verrucomicrobiae bacterium]|nr:response regulator [Verrucomicrobiae bacterium]
MAKVLIVDDESVNLELMEALLSQDGFQVFKASNGELAVSAAQEVRPDVILMDIVMPKMSGVEACRKIKTSPLTYAIPIVIITALNTQEEKVKAIRAGADDFIGKPFDAVELSARLKTLVRAKAVHDRLEASLASLREMQRLREELLKKTATDVEQPLRVISECLQLVAAEQHVLSTRVQQQIEPALFCVDMVNSMVADFAGIMSMEQEKLMQAYESLNAQRVQPLPPETPPQQT